MYTKDETQIIDGENLNFIIGHDTKQTTRLTEVNKSLNAKEAVYIDMITKSDN